MTWNMPPPFGGMHEPGPAGQSAYQIAVAHGYSGSEAAWLASLVGPAGASGSPGSPGTPGAAATVSVGSVTTGAPGSSASVTNTGTSAAAVLAFAIPRGDAGANGTNGANGAAATVAVGSVTTGAPGSSATVTNVGTSAAAVLNFAIPRGDAGPSKRMEVHSGTTNASGLFNVTFSPAFAAPPIVLIEDYTTTGHVWMKVSTTASGFSYRLGNRGVLSVLGLEVLAGSVTNVTGAAVRALVVEA